MLVNPEALQFSGAIDPRVQRQQAGYDLTLKHVAKFNGTGAIDFSNQHRLLPTTETLEFVSENRQHLLFCDLEPGAYQVTYNETIEIPANCAGLVLPRSSLLRSGCTLHSALWDPGYKGKGIGLLVAYQPLRLFKNARIGQMVFIRLESSATTLYSGRYLNENL